MTDGQRDVTGTVIVFSKIGLGIKNTDVIYQIEASNVPIIISYDTGPALSYKLRYIVGLRTVEIVKPKLTKYRKLYENTILAVRSLI